MIDVPRIHLRFAVHSVLAGKKGDPIEHVAGQIRTAVYIYSKGHAVHHPFRNPYICPADSFFIACFSGILLFYHITFDKQNIRQTTHQSGS